MSSIEIIFPFIIRSVYVNARERRGGEGREKKEHDRQLCWHFIGFLSYI